jgi:hypothetical protein
MKGAPAAAGYPKAAKKKKPVKKAAEGTFDVPGMAALALGGLKKLTERKERIAAEKEKDKEN